VKFKYRSSLLSFSPTWSLLYTYQHVDEKGSTVGRYRNVDGGLRNASINLSKYSQSKTHLLTMYVSLRISVLFYYLQNLSLPKANFYNIRRSFFYFLVKQNWSNSFDLSEFWVGIVLKRFCAWIVNVLKFTRPQSCRVKVLSLFYETFFYRKSGKFVAICRQLLVCRRLVLRTHIFDLPDFWYYFV
jgi:hypothetical protein